MNIALVDPIAATANITSHSFVHPEVPSLGLDARSIEETKLVELAAALARRGHRASVVFGDVFLDGRSWNLPNGVRIEPVETVLRVPFHPGLLPATPGLLSHPALSEADVIQASEFHQLATFFACVASGELGVPLVVWQETFRRMRFPGWLYQRTYESTLGRFVRERARRFVPRTTNARGYLRDLRVEEGVIGPWIPTGIDVERFAPRKSRLSTADFGWQDGLPLVLVVARLHPTKGVDLALRALKWVSRRRPEVRMIVRGSGPEEGALVRGAKDLGIEDRVRFIARMSRADMIELYNLADLVLSTSRIDLLPFALMEASACGRPCVATDVGAVRDIVVDGRTGVVAPERTAEGIGRAVSSLLEDDDRRESLGAEARHRAERYFALSVVADRLLGVYRDVAG